MIIEKRIKEFERFGLGLFVHFGAYSVIGKGEWSQYLVPIDKEEYQKAVECFNPYEGWAKELVSVAKTAGARYITLTTRHHDGFSLFDCTELNDYNTVSYYGRDLVREFVDACREEGIVPFLYHTLLDWHHEAYNTDFKEYLKYLRKSVELLCKNYGKIGGFWFDGMWNKKGEDWEEDALYSLIRSYQPDAMIINNSGMGAIGAVGHIGLDSVTFERGNPKPINQPDAPKYLASEMCQVLNNHWGFAKLDFNYKSPANIIRDFVNCRRYGANFLLNVGPQSDGHIRTIDKGFLDILGEWLNLNKPIRSALPIDIKCENEKDFMVIGEDNNIYLVQDGFQMWGSVDVVKSEENKYGDAIFYTDKKVDSITYIDDGTVAKFTQDGSKVSVTRMPTSYGFCPVIRLAKIDFAK